MKRRPSRPSLAAHAYVITEAVKRANARYAKILDPTGRLRAMHADGDYSFTGCVPGLADAAACTTLAVAPADLASPIPDPIPDPVCTKTCRKCWACLRLLHGSDYWLLGVA